MFFIKTKKEMQSRTIKMRDEWGVLHVLPLHQGIPFLTDKELAAQLGVSQTTVETHRRD